MTFPPMQAILPAGRVPDPPRRSLGIAALVTGLFVLLGAGLTAAGIALGSTALGVIGRVDLGVCAALLIVGAVLWLLERRLRPGRELCWCPVVPGQRFALSFTAQAVRHHGVWLVLDMTFPVAARDYRVVTSLHVVASGRVAFGEEVASCWRVDPERADDVGHSSAAVGPPRAAGAAAVLRSVVEIDRTVEIDGGTDHRQGPPSGVTPQSGTLRTRSLLCKLVALTPGESVEILGTLQCPDFPTAMRAHALVALPRHPWWLAAHR